VNLAKIATFFSEISFAALLSGADSLNWRRRKFYFRPLFVSERRKIPRGKAETRAADSRLPL